MARGGVELLHAPFGKKGKDARPAPFFLFPAIILVVIAIFSRLFCFAHVRSLSLSFILVPFFCLFSHFRRPPFPPLFPHFLPQNIPFF